MFIFAEIIILIASTIISGELLSDYDEKTALGERTLPPDLQIQIYVNKTDDDLQFEDCMNSYSLCRGSARLRDKDGVCALDRASGVKKSFESFCEMVYENCKNMNSKWGYFHDGHCELIEFGPA
ncbi:hypothetical protein B5X24_HaOG202242 [Helicoverpa armigera]|uniref:Uncharacterized protein n=1 Tax=Helicoverpa armigera TaxID=29058 RepID=A0A2W1C035_HELAM|nr:hypothetical protein B5X24_HaOG202242 [Helicoverpa armigera]